MHFLNIPSKILAISVLTISIISFDLFTSAQAGEKRLREWERPMEFPEQPNYIPREILVTILQYINRDDQSRSVAAFCEVCKDFLYAAQETPLFLKVLYDRNTKVIDMYHILKAEKFLEKINTYYSATTSLSLKGINCVDEDWMMGLNRFKRIMELTIQINNTREASHLSHFLATSDTIKSLNLKYRYKHIDLSHSEVIDVYSFELGKGLKENKTLEKLSLSNDRCIFNFCYDVYDEMFSHSSLKEINLQNTSLRYYDLERISEVLQNNVVLLTLDLSDNTFNHPAFVTLSSVLKKNKHLKTLNLRNTYSYEGQLEVLDDRQLCTDILAEVLLENTSLEHLNLANNSLNKANVLNLMAALRVNITLKVLNLRMNGLSRNTVVKLKNEFGDRVLF